MLRAYQKTSQDLLPSPAKQLYTSALSPAVPAVLNNRRCPRKAPKGQEGQQSQCCQDRQRQLASAAKAGRWHGLHVQHRLGHTCYCCSLVGR